MKTWKARLRRGFALFLALTMCLSMLQLTAFAADENSRSGTANHTHHAEGWICTPYCSIPEHTHTEDCYHMAENEELARTPMTLPDDRLVEDGTGTEFDDFGNRYETPEYIGPVQDPEGDPGEDGGFAVGGDDGIAVDGGEDDGFAVGGDDDGFAVGGEDDGFAVGSEDDGFGVPPAEGDGSSDADASDGNTDDANDNSGNTDASAGDAQESAGGNQETAGQSEGESSSDDGEDNEPVVIAENEPAVPQAGNLELQCEMEEHKHTDACGEKEDGGWFCVPDTNITINVPEGKLVTGKVDLLEGVTTSPAYCGNWPVRVAVTSVTVKDSADAAESTEVEPEDNQWLDVDSGKVYEVEYVAYLDTAVAASVISERGEVPELPEIMQTRELEGKKLEGAVAYNNEGYATFAKAVMAAAKAKDTNPTFTLLEDVTQSVAGLTNMTIDLDGHTLTGSLNTKGTITISNDVSVTVKNGTIKVPEGYTDHGGAIYAEKCDLTVEKCKIEGASKSLVYAASTSATTHPAVNLTIKNSSFANATYAAVYAAVEGSVKDRSMKVDISDTTFTSNTRGLHCSVNNSIPKPKFDVSVNGCTFEGSTKAGISIANHKNNVDNFTVNVNDTNFLNSTGAALMMASYSDYATVSFTGGEISGNAVSYSSDSVIRVNGPFVMDGTSVSDNEGYHIMDLQYPSSVSIKDAVISGNTSRATDSLSMGGGGPVLIKAATGAIEISSNTKFIGNNAGNYGGALCIYNTAAIPVTIDGCEFIGNTSKGYGGAIYSSNKGDVTIKDTTITNNTANSVVSKAAAYGYIGGGLYVANTTGTVTLSGDTHIYNNKTPGDKLIPGTSTGGSADIVLASNTTTSSTNAKNPDYFTRANLVIECDEETVQDEVVYTLTQFNRKLITTNGWYYPGSGSNYSWPMGYYSSVVEPARVFLGTKGQHSGNEAIVTATAQEAVDAAKAAGLDKVYVCGTHSLMQDAEAMNANPGIQFIRCSEHGQSAMFSISGGGNTATLAGAHINGQNVSSGSALITVSAGAELILEDGTIIENGSNTLTGKGCGGGISLSQSTLRMNGGTVTRNQAKTGGGIYAWSNINGSAIYFEGGTVSNNTAMGSYGNGGGALLGYTPSYFGVNGGRTVFTGNTAYIGGGVYLDGNTHYVSKASFTNNTALRPIAGEYYCGGGMYIERNTTVYMKNVFIYGNKAASASRPASALGICPTGTLKSYYMEGYLSVNNAGEPDIGMNRTNNSVNPMFSFGQNKDAIISVPNYAIGGGQIGYDAMDSFGNHVVLKDIDNDWLMEHGKGGMLMLKTVVSDNTIAWARERAEADGVLVTGNSAYGYGSGIMTNGNVIIGKDTAMAKVAKVWLDCTPKKGQSIMLYLTRYNEETQKFERVDPADRKDAYVVLNAENNWQYEWKELDPFAKWGVQEAALAGYESTVILGGKVSMTADGTEVDSEDLNLDKVVQNIEIPQLTVSVNSISKVAVDENGNVIETEMDIPENAEITVRLVSPEQTAEPDEPYQKPERPEPELPPETEDANPEIETLSLSNMHFSEGEEDIEPPAVNEVVLSKENNWTYTWETLPGATEDNWRDYSYEIVNAKGLENEDGNLLVKLQGNSLYRTDSNGITQSFVINHVVDNGAMDLVITKTAHGLDKATKYQFQITLPKDSDSVDENGDPIYYSYYYMDGKEYIYFEGDEVKTSQSQVPNPIYNNEKIEVELKDGWSVTLPGLPEGTKYTVTEVPSDDFIPWINGNLSEDGSNSVSGSIGANGNSSADGNSGADGNSSATAVNFVNVPKTQIEVTKTWDDEDDRFGLRPKSISVSLFRCDGEGEAKKEIKIADDTIKPDANGEWKCTFKGLPKLDCNGKALTYVVKENRDESLQPYEPLQPSEITLDGEGPFSVLLNNKILPVGSLTISKELKGNDVDTKYDWTFKLTLSVAKGKVPEPLTVADGKDAKVVLEESSKDEKTRTYQVTLKGGEFVTITNLAPGTEYEVTEVQANKNGYTTTSEGITGSIKSDTRARAQFTNTRSSLEVSKTVTGNAGDKDKAFTFTVKLTPPEGMALPATLNVVGESIDGVEAPASTPVDVIDGTCTFTLKHGQTLRLVGVPVGTTYEVTETEADQDGYTTTVDGETGTIEETGSVPTAAFTNHKDPVTPPPTTPDPDPGPGPGPNPPPTPEVPVDNPPPPLTDLPDPNDPESPEEVTVLEDDVPKTYVKVWDPEEEEYVYVPEDDVPLATVVPKTGDSFSAGFWTVLCLTSAAGLAVLTMTKPKKEEEMN